MNIRLSSDQIKQPDRPKLADITGPGLITGTLDDPHISADVRDPDDQCARTAIDIGTSTSRPK